MRIARTIGRMLALWMSAVGMSTLGMLALGMIGPSALAAQTTHNLSMHDRVRVLYTSGANGGSVEGDVLKLTQDSLGLAIRDNGTMTLAWGDITAASVWRTQKPKRYIGGMMGGVVGAMVGGFVAVNRDQSQPVGGSLSGWTVGKGAAVGGVAGILVGVGVSQLLKPHGWQRVELQTQVAGLRPTMGMSVAVGGK